jgi:REP element-mobilizing transposase RayT
MDAQERRTRKALRLPTYDYGRTGGYYVTAVTHQRALLFGKPEAEEIVRAAWEALPSQFPDVTLDAFVVMPNHVHGIVVIEDGEPAHIRSAGGGKRAQMMLPRVMNYFKSRVARNINRLRGQGGGPVWQRGYYEHVIRGEADLVRIRTYIEENPLKWDLDEYNPDRKRRG